MLVILMGGAQPDNLEKKFWSGFLITLSNSQLYEIIIVSVIFIGFGYFFAYSLLCYINFFKKHSQKYLKLAYFFIAFVYAIFFSEFLEFYFLSMREGAELPSMLMSSLFFSPIAIGVVGKIFWFSVLSQNYFKKLEVRYFEERNSKNSINDIQKFILNENSKNELRMIVRSIVIEELNEMKNYSLARIYDENTEIGNEWTERVSDGHWATSIFDEVTRKFTVKHSRTRKNLQLNNFDVRLKQEQEYNREAVYGHPENKRFKPDFLIEKIGSIYVPRDKK